MDQSFSPKNLRSIWDLEARRGRDRLELYSHVRRAYEVARDAAQRARAISQTVVPYIGTPASSPDEVARATRNNAEELLEESLATTSQELIRSVEAKTFTWGLALGKLIAGSRQTYSISDTAEAFFADKQLQRVVAHILPSHPRGRQSIVAALIRSLDNDLPKVVVRADVKDFYGTIDHNELRVLLDTTEVSPTSRHLVNQLLMEMESLTGRAKGLPAGVGLSAKLAEFYIAQTDRTLRDSLGTLYFARYVDDIVLVRGGERQSDIAPSDVIAEIDAELTNIGLSLNESKTSSRELFNNSIGKFEFLGYEIEYRGSSGMVVRLNSARYRTIRKRIDKTFDAWDRADQNNDGRRSLLLDRLRFLTGNTRLSHNKRNALVGIYFSNPHLSDVRSLGALDHYLRYRASQSTLPPGLAQKIQDLSFEEGFLRRTVHRWPMQRMKRLKGAWLA